MIVIKLPSASHQSGFTLIETLVAIVIFSAALISLMTIASRGIAATAIAEQETIAHYLAQEGLEVVRNIRDTNILVPQAWDAGLSQCVSPVGGSPVTCMVVYSQNSVPSLSVCPQGGCQVYQSLIDNSFINGPAGAQINPVFSREISLVPSGAGGTEYQVITKVFWTAKTIPRTVELQTILKKWR
jgi:prepilin-type N-terminal cleavage/methylation domain-containing protein